MAEMNSTVGPLLLKLEHQLRRERGAWGIFPGVTAERGRHQAPKPFFFANATSTSATKQKQNQNLN